MGLTVRGNEKEPYEIIKDHHIVKIASGSDHLVFLTNRGEVYTCGNAEQGQLGRTSERGSTRNARAGLGKGAVGMDTSARRRHFFIYYYLAYVILHGLWKINK